MGFSHDLHSALVWRIEACIVFSQVAQASLVVEMASGATLHEASATPPRYPNVWYEKNLALSDVNNVEMLQILAV